MNIYEIMYTCSSTIAVLASIPQVRQIIVTKLAEELSLLTWSLWFCTQTISLVYAISIRNSLLMMVNLIWISFYALMICLIVYYRKYPGGMKRRVVNELAAEEQIS